MAYAFPKVKIVSTACDTQLEEKTCFIRPGLGNFGDRYFGTDSIASISDTEDGTNFPINNTGSQSGTPNSPLTGFPRNLNSEPSRDLSPPLSMRALDCEDVFNTI